MKTFIPLEKRSKKAQRAEHALRRGSWNGINPVTRTSANPRAYNRNQFKRGEGSS